MVKRYEEIVVSHVIGSPVLTRVVERSSGNYVLHSDYSALELRLAELEKDAARYRALVDSGKYCPSFGSGYWGLRAGGFGRVSKEELDSAVDESMSREA